jgi:hypothetical protein
MNTLFDTAHQVLSKNTELLLHLDKLKYRNKSLSNDLLKVFDDGEKHITRHRVPLKDFFKESPKSEKLISSVHSPISPIDRVSNDSVEAFVELLEDYTSIINYNNDVEQQKPTIYRKILNIIKANKSNPDFFNHRIPALYNPNIIYSLFEKVIETNSPQFVKLFIKYGAITYSQNKCELNNALFAYTRSSNKINEDIVYAILYNNKDNLAQKQEEVNFVNKGSNESCLYRGFVSLNFKLIYTLIKYGADINFVFDTNETYLTKFGKFIKENGMAYLKVEDASLTEKELDKIPIIKLFKFILANINPNHLFIQDNNGETIMSILNNLNSNNVYNSYDFSIHRVDINPVKRIFITILQSYFNKLNIHTDITSDNLVFLNKEKFNKFIISSKQLQDKLDIVFTKIKVQKREFFKDTTTEKFKEEFDEAEINEIIQIIRAHKGCSAYLNSIIESAIYINNFEIIQAIIYNFGKGDKLNKDVILTCLIAISLSYHSYRQDFIDHRIFHLIIDSNKYNDFALNYFTNYVYTLPPLHYAIQTNSPDIFKKLIKKGANMIYYVSGTTILNNIINYINYHRVNFPTDSKLEEMIVYYIDTLMKTDKYTKEQKVALFKYGLLNKVDNIQNEKIKKAIQKAIVKLGIS